MRKKKKTDSRTQFAESPGQKIYAQNVRASKRSLLYYILTFSLPFFAVCVVIWIYVAYEPSSQPNPDDAPERTASYDNMLVSANLNGCDVEMNIILEYTNSSTYNSIDYRILKIPSFSSTSYQAQELTDFSALINDFEANMTTEVEDFNYALNIFLPGKTPLEDGKGVLDLSYVIKNAVDEKGNLVLDIIGGFPHPLSSVVATLDLGIDKAPLKLFSGQSTLESASPDLISYNESLGKYQFGFSQAIPDSAHFLITSSGLKCSKST